MTEVVCAECSCPAGKAPYASCKHLAAFLYAMEEFSRLGYTQDPVTCTDELQTWNKPHKKKSEPMKFSEMSWSKSRGKTSRIKRQAGHHQDPRALLERGHTVKTAVEIFHQYWWIFIVPNKPLILVEIIHLPTMVVYYHHAWWFIATKCGGNSTPLNTHAIQIGSNFNFNQVPYKYYQRTLPKNTTRSVRDIFYPVRTNVESNKC